MQASEAVFGYLRWNVNVDLNCNAEAAILRLSDVTSRVDRRDHSNVRNQRIFRYCDSTFSPPTALEVQAARSATRNMRPEWQPWSLVDSDNLNVVCDVFRLKF